MVFQCILLLLLSTLGGNVSAAETRLFSIRKGDSTVREWNPTSASFLTNLLQLTDLNAPVTTASDVEFDGTYFYTISEDGQFIKRFDAAGRYLDAILLSETSGVPVSQPQIGLAAFGGFFYTIAAGDPRIRQFDSTGHFLGDVGVLVDALGFNTRMTGIATDGTYFYTIAAGDPRMGKWELDGTFIGDVPGFNYNGNPDANNSGMAIQALPPVFVGNPSSLERVIGTTATFDVAVDGLQPISIQWFFNGVPLLGATSTSLVLPNVTTSASGSYFAVASNLVGSVTSIMATLEVWIPPTITSHPSALTVVAGNSATFQVQASGSEPLSMQWYFNGTPIAAGISAALPLNSVQPNQAGSYYAVVSNVVTSVTSAVVSLVVWTPPGISGQPQDVGTNPGQDVSLTVEASGNPNPDIQWYFNGSSISGATMSTLWLQNVQATHWGYYFAVLSNVVAVQTSRVATVWVTNAPVIVWEPQSVNAALGGSATLSVGIVSFENESYQWYFKKRPVPGATGPSLTIDSLRARAAGTYHVDIWNTVGTSRSQDVMLRVFRPAKLVIQPRSASAISGKTVKLRSRATGAKPLFYQWMRDGVPMPGATTPKLVLTNASAETSGSYSVVVSNIVSSVTSSPAVVVVQ